MTAPLPPPASRAVRRAGAELRAGSPVILGAAPSLVLLAAETATEPALAEFRAASADPPLLLRAFPPAGALHAVALAARDLTPTRLRALADGPAMGPAAPAPAAAAAALKLARLALLLPRVIAAPAGPNPADLLHVRAADILAHTPQTQRLHRAAEATVPLAEAADCRVVAFRPEDGGTEHLAVLIGRPEAAVAPLVRLHSECVTGDLLGSLRCDCGPQLHGALRRMADEGAGVLLYLAQEGRGIGLVNKLRAYALQDAGLDTLEANLALGFAADERSFAPAADMLRALGITRIRLLTNNPQKLAGLAACGIEIAGRVAHAFAANGVNDAYLATKAARFGHLLG